MLSDKQIAWGTTAAVLLALGAVYWKRGIRVGNYVALAPNAVLAPVDGAKIAEELPPGAELVMLVQGVEGNRVRGILSGLLYQGKFDDTDIAKVPLVADAAFVRGVAAPPVKTLTV